MKMIIFYFPFINELIKTMIADNVWAFIIAFIIMITINGKWNKWISKTKIKYNSYEKKPLNKLDVRKQLKDFFEKINI